MVKTGIARFEFVHYSAHGATGDFAHLVSECAADQDRFWEFHDQLMSRNRNLYNQAGASAYAGTLGMDVEQFGAVPFGADACGEDPAEPAGCAGFGGFLHTGAVR